MYASQFISWNLMNRLLPSDVDETTGVVILIRLLALVVQIFSLKVTLDAVCKVLPFITAQG